MPLEQLHHSQRKSRRRLQRNQPATALRVPMPRTKGPLWEVDDEWRKNALSEMKTRSISRAALTRMLPPPVDKSAITILFRMSTNTPPGPRTSRIAKAVADVLGVPLPKQIMTAEERQALKILRMAREKHPVRFGHVLALLEEMAGVEKTSHARKKT
jgi:hypothetical protein